jgi:DNA-binding CsgD family transcriptional regulator
MASVSMIGRSRELNELIRIWTRVAAGTTDAAGTVVITGSPGIGKTRLVASALESFSPRPSDVFSGTARVHAPGPYDWLAAILAGRGTDELPIPPEALGWLAQHPDVPSQRYAPEALLRLAVRAVRSLVGDGPAVLVVEDLHALDPASLNLVGELATTSNLPAMLLVTSRPPDTAVSPKLAARTLARLSGTRGALRQHLRPLRPADVGEILAQAYPGRRLPAGTAHAVWERTAGNPYWLTELLAAAGGGGPEALASEPLPGHLTLAAPQEDALEEGGVNPDLTAREREVLSCLAKGMSNKQVARSLGISIRTVTVHVSNLLRKTRSRSRTEAALWAVHRRPAGPGRPVETTPPA